MILFTIKLINSLRKAIAGRRHPSQLAWGVAFGVLLGLIPHGNLLAVVLVLGVLMLHVNHAMVALVGIGLTFFAPRFDPQFDAFGRWFFEHPEASKAMASAWQYPLVPWTDLNNTVVMGSFLIGLAALLPIYLLTRPIFKRWAMAVEEASEISGDEELSAAEETADRVRRQIQPSDDAVGSVSIRMDSNHGQGQPHTAPVDTPRRESAPSSGSEGTVGSDSLMKASSGRVYDVRRIDAAESHPSPSRRTSDQPTVDQPTGADPVRTQVAIQPSEADRSRTLSMNAPAESTSARPKALSTKITGVKASEMNFSRNGVEAATSSADDQQKIDEALSYLLRQLRDSKDKDAA